MSRQTYLLGLAIALLGCAMALTHELLSPWPGVSERNVRHIREGMTLREVERLLGGPPTGHLWIQNSEGTLYWDGVQGRIYVPFIGDYISGDLQVGSGCRARFERLPGQQEDLGLLTRLRTWLGW
jgi:hypothetical protein